MSWKVWVKLQMLCAIFVLLGSTTLFISYYSLLYQVHKTLAALFCIEAAPLG